MSIVSTEHNMCRYYTRYKRIMNVSIFSEKLFGSIFVTLVIFLVCFVGKMVYKLNKSVNM